MSIVFIGLCAGSLLVEVANRYFMPFLTILTIFSVLYLDKIIDTSRSDPINRPAGKNQGLMYNKTMKSANPLVSIVIPVYNVEQYLDACLDSVVSQSYKNIEIILVDDGSPDNSGKKCDEWAKKDKRITVVHKLNEGLNYARKSGYEVANGDYITFLDSDDLFHPDNIQNSVTIAQKYDLDMVAYMYLEFSDKDELSNNLKPEIHEEYDIKKSTVDTYKFLLLNGYDNLYPMTAWGKLYKKDVISNINWEESNLRAFEDNFFTAQAFDNVRLSAVLKQQLYFYRRNSNGSVLSRTLVGNTLNGRPVGYLEYMVLMHKYWTKYFNKHKVGLKKELDEFRHNGMVFRMNNLINSGLLGSENNLEYLGGVIREAQERSDEKIKELGVIIEEQADLSREKDRKIIDLENEMARLHTLRGSIGNTAKSLKSTIKKRI